MLSSREWVILDRASSTDCCSSCSPAKYEPNSSPGRSVYPAMELDDMGTCPCAVLTEVKRHPSFPHVQGKGWPMNGVIQSHPLNLWMPSVQPEKPRYPCHRLLIWRCQSSVPSLSQVSLWFLNFLAIFSFWKHCIQVWVKRCGRLLASRNHRSSFT